MDGVTTISIDDVAAAQLATEHLISLGHRQIMHIGTDQGKEVDFHTHDQRYIGFQRAMIAAGLDASTYRRTELTIAGGFATGLSVLADPRHRPPAIMAGSDEVAIGVIVAARQLGIGVPDQLSVIGIDGHELAPMFGLTTLAQDPAGQGGAAVDLVVEELLGATSGPSPAWHPYPVHLEVRGSTTAPR